MKEPDAAGVGPGWLGPNERLDRSGADGEEQALQDGEVETLVFEREGQMPGKARLRRMPGRQDAPAVPLEDAVVGADGRERARQRHLQGPGVDQRGVADRRCGLGKPPLLKNGHGT